MITSVSGFTSAWEDPRALLVEQSPGVCTNACAPLLGSYVTHSGGAAESHMLAKQGPTPAFACTTALTS